MFEDYNAISCAENIFAKGVDVAFYCMLGCLHRSQTTGDGNMKTIYFARNVSHYGISCGGYGTSPESAIAAIQKEFPFVTFKTEKSEAFFDGESGVHRWPETRGFPPFNVKFAPGVKDAVVENADESRTVIGYAGVFHRDHRGEN